MAHFKYFRVFSLAEIVIGVVLLALGTSSATYYISSTIEARSHMQLTSQRESYSSFQQEAALAGLDAELVNPLGGVLYVEGSGRGGVVESPVLSVSWDSVQEVSVPEVKGRTLLTSVKTDVVSASGDSVVLSTRASGYGLLLSADADEVPTDVVGGKLNAPFWPALNMLMTSDFVGGGYTVYLVLPDNPLGTYYVYTTDGSDPTFGSSTWMGAKTYSNIMAMPPVLRARAMHSDLRYEPSDIVETIPSVGLELTYARVGSLTDQTDTQFYYGDLTGKNPITGASCPTNGFVVLDVNVTAPASVYEIVYELGGTSRTMSGAISDLPAPQLDWSSGVSLRAQAFPLASVTRYRPSAVLERVLTAKAVALSPPDVEQDPTVSFEVNVEVPAHDDYADCEHSDFDPVGVNFLY